MYDEYKRIISLRGYIIGLLIINGANK